ncbi:hypothetical protein QOT17_018322 [Balamuthia mandrillaris]
MMRPAGVNVRQQSLFQKVFYFPRYFWDQFEEDILLGWPTLASNLSLALVACLNFLLVALKLNLIASQLEVGVCLLMLSILNSFAFLTKRKSYQLFNCSAPPQSPNAVEAFLYTEADPTVMPRQIFELHVWNPSDFTTTLFCYFSPLQVAIILAGDSDNYSNLMFHLVLGLLSAIFLATVVQLYQGLQRDQKILFSQAYEENNRFAMARLAVPKSDSAVQVDHGIDAADEDLTQVMSTESMLIASPRYSGQRSSSYASSYSGGGSVATTPYSAPSSSSSYTAVPVQSPTASFSSPSINTTNSPKSSSTTKRKRRKSNPFQSARYS